jgi:molybdate transport system permease protein
MSILTSADWAAVWLTLKLAGTTTAILLGVGTPIAWCYRPPCSVFTC